MLNDLRAEVRSRSCCCRSWDWLLHPKSSKDCKMEHDNTNSKFWLLIKYCTFAKSSYPVSLPVYFLSHKFSGIMQQTSPERECSNLLQLSIESISSCAERIIIMNMHRNQVFFIAPCLAHKWNFIAAHTPQYSLISTFSIDKIIKLFDRLWLLTCSGGIFFYALDKTVYSFRFLPPSLASHRRGLIV